MKFHEKKLGQLFCDEKCTTNYRYAALECEMANVTLKKEMIIDNVDKQDDQYFIDCDSENILVTH